MNFLGVGPTEVVFVIIIALMVFGPRRLPEIAAQLGKYYRTFWQMTQQVRTEWKQEFSELDELRQEIQTETQKLKDTLPTSPIKQIKDDIKSQVENTVSITKSVTDGLNAPVENTISVAKSPTITTPNGNNSTPKEQIDE